MTSEMHTPAAQTSARCRCLEKDQP